MRDILVVLFRNAAPASGSPRNQVIPDSISATKKGFLHHGDSITFVNTRPCDVKVRFATELVSDLTPGPGAPPAYYELALPANQFKTVEALKKTQNPDGDAYGFVFDPPCGGEGNVGKRFIEGELVPLATPGDDPTIVIG